MSNEARRCPHCDRPVEKTRRDNIAAHYTPTGAPCPASDGYPYKLAVRP